MGKIIAIGGGTNGGDFDPYLEEKIRKFINKDQPKVIFIPYASTDDEENYQQFFKIYELLGCEVELLQPGLENLLLEADLIYFGRGSTIQLIDKLKESKVIPFLNQAFENGTILAGFSAGAHALFTFAGSYEMEMGYTIVEGLGFVNGCIMSHYNYQDRAEAFHNLLIERGFSGIGLDDHTMMIVEKNVGSLYSSKLESNGYFIQNQDSNLSIYTIKSEKIVIPF
ncbi:Type 1 glutamine amidotransferase-like domain-containing protein [Heyndrickxia sp. MSNUG]|uniref:Type 1 glutamine amidotransferase-like domain-containing protein n=1 Tax=Heyndrickxia sp. MSNUG TaxID=3136677 RepID=UPI003C2E679B